jgi:hypothetical protein
MTHQWAQPASQLGDDRGLSEDRSPGTAQKGNGACENWPLLIPRLKSVRESGRDIARPFAIYINCKSTVSSVHGCRVEFFFDGKTRASFFGPTRMRSVGNFGGRACNATRSALHQSSDGPPWGKSCRRRQAESAARPRWACAAPAGAPERARAPGLSISPEEFPVDS